METVLNFELNNKDFIIAEAFDAILALSSQEFVEGVKFSDIPILKSCIQKIDKNESLVFLLPAFPAKSSSPKKTSGIHPDMGEILALKNLNDMCKRISNVYGPGAKVVICSDGRVFSDVVAVPDEHIDEYGEWIEGIIKEFKLSYLTTFSMDNMYQELKGDALRERLVWRYAKSLEEIRFLVINDDNYRALFNGVHRFMVEDHEALEMNAHLSKNQLSKKTKALTYELIRRSDAWSELLTDQFGDALRLSIHAYPLEHLKFGVKLIPSSDKWATPWHNVAVKHGDSFTLMHKSKAIELGAVERKYGGKYAYFEL